jgi:hypothetical protein
LAETREVLSIVNRSGNRPSHEGAAAEVDRAIALCDKAGFEKIVLRGDTDFRQTHHLDRWDSNPKVRFVFGYDCTRNLEEVAANLPESAWRRLERPARYRVETQPRRRPVNVKEQIVKEREFENKRLASEDVAEFLYQPTACRDPYRMVVVRKNISVEKGEQVLFPLIEYFFYIANDWDWTQAEVVFEANDRCNQENDIAQVKNAVRALHAPLDNLESNWAYMLMSLPRRTSRRQTVGSQNRVQDVPQRLHAAAVPNREDRPQTGVSSPELEPTPAHLFPFARCAQLLTTVN